MRVLLPALLVAGFAVPALPAAARATPTPVFRSVADLVRSMCESPG